MNYHWLSVALLDYDWLALLLQAGDKDRSMRSIGWLGTNGFLSAPIRKQQTAVFCSLPSGLPLGAGWHNPAHQIFKVLRPRITGLTRASWERPPLWSIHLSRRLPPAPVSDRVVVSVPLTEGILRIGSCIAVTVAVPPCRTTLLQVSLRVQKVKVLVVVKQSIAGL